MVTERMREKIGEARKFASRAPQRRREAIEDYIREGEAVVKELNGHLFSPRIAAGGGDYIDLVGAKEAAQGSLEAAELLMREVLAEEPQGAVEADGEGVTDPFEVEMDVEASCRRLALKTARETIFMARADRLQQGYMQFLEAVEPHVPHPAALREAGADPDLAKVPERKFTRLLDYLVGLDPKKLSELEDADVKELEELWEEPEDAEAGTPGEGPSDTADMPDDAHVGGGVPRASDGYPAPEETDEHTPARGGEEFEGEGAATRNGRRNRAGRNAARGNRKRDGSAKTANAAKPGAAKAKAAHRPRKVERVQKVHIASAPPELADYGVDPRGVEGTVQKVAETTHDGPNGSATYWLEHEGTLFGMTRPDVAPLVRRTARQAARRKTANLHCLIANPPDELRKYAIDPGLVVDELQPVDSVDFEDGESEPTVWIEHEDSLIGFDPLDVELLEVVPEEDTEVVDSLPDAAGSEGDEGAEDDDHEFPRDFSDNDNDEDDEEEEEGEKRGGRRARGGSSRGRPPPRAGGRRRAVEDESGVEGLHSSEEAPEPERAYEEEFEEMAESNTPAPRGPNRRLPDDVPAHSTPREMLTARKNAARRAAMRVRASLSREGIDVELRDVPALVRAVVGSPGTPLGGKAGDGRPVNGAARSKRAMSDDEYYGLQAACEIVARNYRLPADGVELFGDIMDAFYAGEGGGAESIPDDPMHGLPEYDGSEPYEDYLVRHNIDS